MAPPAKRTYGQKWTITQVAPIKNERKGKRRVRKPLETITETLNHSNAESSRGVIMEDPFDKLVLSPMKQPVTFKPLSHWGKKVAELERTEVKSKAKDLYELSSPDDSNPKLKKLRRPKPRKKDKNTLVNNLLKSTLKSVPYKGEKLNRIKNEGALIKERIMLKKAEVNMDGDLFTFNNQLPIFGLSSTPGQSNRINIVKPSFFEFYSPIKMDLSTGTPKTALLKSSHCNGSHPSRIRMTVTPPCGKSSTIKTAHDTRNAVSLRDTSNEETLHSNEGKTEEKNVLFKEQFSAKSERPLWRATNVALKDVNQIRDDISDSFQGKIEVTPPSPSHLKNETDYLFTSCGSCEGSGFIGFSPCNNSHGKSVTRQAPRLLASGSDSIMTTSLAQNNETIPYQRSSFEQSYDEDYDKKGWDRYVTIRRKAARSDDSIPSSLTDCATVLNANEELNAVSLFSASKINYATPQKRSGLRSGAGEIKLASEKAAGSKKVMNMHENKSTSFKKEPVRSDDSTHTECETPEVSKYFSTCVSPSETSSFVLNSSPELVENHSLTKAVPPHIKSPQKMDKAIKPPLFKLPQPEKPCTPVKLSAIDFNVSSRARARRSELLEEDGGITGLPCMNRTNLQMSSMVLKGGKQHNRARAVLRQLQTGRLTLHNASLLPVAPQGRGRGYESFVENLLEMQPETLLLDVTSVSPQWVSRRPRTRSLTSKRKSQLQASVCIPSLPKLRGPSVAPSRTNINVKNSRLESLSSTLLNASLLQNKINKTVSWNDTVVNSKMFRGPSTHFLSAKPNTTRRESHLEQSCYFGNTSIRVVPTDDHEPTAFRSAFGICDTSNHDDVEGTLVDTVTARDAILLRCGQEEPLVFKDHFTELTLPNCKKIGEGVYGEVYMYNSSSAELTVLKVIPIEGDLLVNGEPQKSFEEVLSEIVISMELSDLRNGLKQRCSGFAELRRVWCVIGEYPELLQDLWNDFDIEKGSENDTPSIFGDDQLYIVLELAHGGLDLEAFVFNNAMQASGAFRQAALSLAVAEQALQFEHRDFHWGNVLVSNTTEKTVTYILDGQEYKLPTEGVKVAIIDFTLSRMSYEGCAVFNDLAIDPELFTSEGDYQFEIYRMMKEETGNIWEKFCPRTNLFWLHYTLDKMLTMVRYSRPRSKKHSEAVKKFRIWQKSVLEFNNTVEFAASFL